MARIVMKFGGTSVGDVARMRRVATKIAAETARGHQVAVVVSAMSGETDRLVKLCRDISPTYDTREYDAVVATGEQVTTGLVALALQDIGLSARSWQGWQVAVLTDQTHSKARISHIRCEALEAAMMAGEIPVMAGFQGISEDGRVTTLGRGGSDTSAVALAAALKADRCDIYTDVDGVYSCDPRIVPLARKIDRITYEEMLELASVGAKVLQTRSVEMAMKHHVPLQVLSSFSDILGSDLPGTMLCKDDEHMEAPLVSGIAYSRDEAKITLVRVSDIPGTAARIFGPLSDAAINIDMIVQNIAEDGLRTDLTFTVSRADLPLVLKVLQENADVIGFEKILSDAKVVKISVVGVGMRSHAGVAQTMFRVLAEKNINIQVISTSEIKVSVLIGEDYTELALRALHAAYGLDKTEEQDA